MLPNSRLGVGFERDALRISLSLLILDESFLLIYDL